MTHAISDAQALICAFELGPVTERDHDLLSDRDLLLEERRLITGRRHALMSLDRHLVARMDDEVDDAEDKILAGERRDQGAPLRRWNGWTRSRRTSSCARSARGSCRKRSPAGWARRRTGTCSSCRS
jgi:hypothetical protein